DPALLDDDLADRSSPLPDEEKVGVAVLCKQRVELAAMRVAVLAGADVGSPRHGHATQVGRPAHLVVNAAVVGVFASGFQEQLVEGLLLGGGHRGGRLSGADQTQSPDGCQQGSRENADAKITTHDRSPVSGVRRGKHAVPRSPQAYPEWQSRCATSL